MHLYTFNTLNVLSLHLLSWLTMTNRHSSGGGRGNLLISLLRQTEQWKDRQIDLHKADEMLSGFDQGNESCSAWAENGSKWGILIHCETEEGWIGESKERQMVAKETERNRLREGRINGKVE